MKKTKNNSITVLLLASLLIAAGIGLFLILRDRSPDRQTTVRGIITSKFTDCVGGEKMDAQGKIVPIEQVTCDGGSTITVDYEHQFITATGNVMPEHAYRKDVSGIKLGDKVLVRYVTNSKGFTSLNCDECGITKED